MLSGDLNGQARRRSVPQRGFALTSDRRLQTGSEHLIAVH